MPFLQRVRLPITTGKPQFPSERNIFTLADGSRKVQSIIIRKQIELETDYLPEFWHQRLIIALSHDTVNIENDFYNTGISIDSEYEIDWQNFLYMPVAKASAKLQVTPFDATNSNCQTCENAAQVALVDDTFPDPLNEGDTDTINVVDNDTINCFPHVLSITWFNTTYVDSATIDPDGVVTIVLKLITPSANAVKLATYRVTCADEAYDEADVYGDIIGSEIICGPPTALTVDDTSATHVELSWTPPVAPPGNGYEWQLYQCSNLGLVLQNGIESVPNVTIAGLSPATCYTFFVRSLCDVDDFSEYVSVNFTTSSPPGADQCGFYEIAFNDGTGDVDHFNNVTYMRCDGVIETVPVYNNAVKFACLRQYSNGAPHMVVGATSVTYLSAC